jgi:hypothetical protein
VQLLVVAKDDNGHIDGAEHGEFIGLLEETSLPLQKCAADKQKHTLVVVVVKTGRLESNLHRTVPLIFDGFDIDLPATHCDGGATGERPVVSKRGCRIRRMLTLTNRG